jgi:D-glycero-alpha-D-manno-heptose-7-phosphate kinase
MKVFAQAPTRISLFGGGTDLPIYYEKYGGMVINMAINLRQQVEIDTDKKGSDLLEKDSLDFISNIIHPLKLDNVYIKHKFDAVMESGLGSSASFAVSLIGAVSKIFNYPLSKRELAERAWDIEVNKIGLYGGKQDQYAAAWGGLNAVWFSPNGEVYRRQIEERNADYLISHLLLFYSGQNRKSSVIQEKFKQPTEQQTLALHKIKSLCNYAKKTLDFGDIEKLGCLLDETWQYKKQSNPLVSNERINTIYEEAILAGAWGGKIMGAGGGGFMAFLADRKYHEPIISSLNDLGCVNIDFSIDKNGLETRKL